MHFTEFSQYLAKLELLSSRLEMMEVLVEVFDNLEEAEVRPACYLLQGQLAPSYQAIDFQLSTKMILRALAQLSANHSQQKAAEPETVDLFGAVTTTDAALAEITLMYKQKGDIGHAAEAVRRQLLAVGENDAQHSAAVPTLKAVEHQSSILSVYQQLCLIAQESGAGSQDRKLVRLTDLLQASDPVSAKYICRIIMGRLRLGFSTMTMLDSLSWLVRGDKSLTAELEEAYQKRADLGELASVILATHRHNNNITTALSQFSVKVGVPVVPALCQRLNTAIEIVDKLHTIIAEPKYDGLRIQIHIWHENSVHQVRAFTRNLDDVTHMFPELKSITASLVCSSCVLDTEAIGFDIDSGKLKTFQETITRKRKHDISAATTAVPLRFYVFDILEKDGHPLIDVPLTERKDILKEVVSPHISQLQITPSITTTDPAKLHEYHTLQLSLGLEGVVAKAANSRYRPGRKGWRWVKIKEAEGSSGKLNDTLDVVIMGYYLGRGKRTQFGLGALLVGITSKNGDTQEQEVRTIAKIGTGMSEAQLVNLKNLVKPLIVSEKPPEYVSVSKMVIPDVWITPFVVIEVAADELTKSPVHSAGFALRFPRLLSIRSDKKWTDATSLSELQHITRPLASE